MYLHINFLIGYFQTACSKVDKKNEAFCSFWIQVFSYVCVIHCHLLFIILSKYFYDNSFYIYSGKTKSICISMSLLKTNDVIFCLEIKPLLPKTPCKAYVSLSNFASNKYLHFIIKGTSIRRTFTLWELDQLVRHTSLNGQFNNSENFAIKGTPSRVGNFSKCNKNHWVMYSLEIINCKFVKDFQFVYIV